MVRWRIDTVTTWVFLRGLVREKGHWGGFVECFEGAMPGVRVVSIDLPGNGALYARKSPTHIEAMAEHCQQSLAAAGIAGKVYVLAMSLGAMVAVEWARRRPDVVIGCVLINTSLRGVSPFWQRMQPRNYPSLLRLAWLRDAREIESLVLRITSNLVRATPEQAERAIAEWIHMRRMHPVSAGNAVRQVLAAMRYRAPVEKPCEQMLLLVSCGDTLVDPRCSMRLALNWACAYECHALAGHDLPLDAPDWTAHAVARWIDATRPDSSRAGSGPATSAM